MADDKKCPCDAMVKAQKDIETHRDRLHKGDVAMAEINLKLENIEKKVDKLEETIDKKFETFAGDIEELKMKPAKRWEGLITTIIALVVGMLFGLLFTKLGIG